MGGGSGQQVSNVRTWARGSLAFSGPHRPWRPWAMPVHWLCVPRCRYGPPTPGPPPEPAGLQEQQQQRQDPALALAQPLAPVVHQLAALPGHHRLVRCACGTAACLGYMPCTGDAVHALSATIAMVATHVPPCERNRQHMGTP